MLRHINSPEKLVEQLATGAFAERHRLEAKRELGAGSQANVELARDLASLAIDGGFLVFGVAENKELRRYSAHPLALKGLAERVEQVAGSRISPRLTVRVRELAYDDGKGFLVVEVPPSPSAPHMVEHSYFGRGDTTKHRLSDADVRRLMDRRRIRQDEFGKLLAAEVERDPTPDELRDQAHLFILARPATGHPHMLHEALRAGGQALQPWAQDALLNGAPGACLDWPCEGWQSPDIGPNLLGPATRAHGVGFHTWQTGPDRVPRPNGERPPSEASLLDFEVDEDGSLHVFSTVSEGRGGRGRDEPRRVLIGLLPATLVLRVARAAVAVSDACRYIGGWQIGLHISDLRGVVSPESLRSSRGSTVAYTSDRYEAQGEFLVDELASGERDVVLRLCGSLFRGLGQPLEP